MSAAGPVAAARLTPSRAGTLRRWVGRGVSFLAAWSVLDRLATAPPLPLPSLAVLIAAGVVLVVGGTLLAGDPLRGGAARLGLGRPALPAVLTAVVVGSAVAATFAVGAALLDVRLTLRPNWPVVLVGVLIFHGLAEELVWRGFAFGHLRRATTFRRALAASMPLIALTHVPIIAGNGWLVGSLAVLTAAATCLPLAYLWERGGGTIWAPAVLHGLIDTWQLVERGYPVSFQIVVLVACILVPQLAMPVHTLIGRYRS